MKSKLVTVILLALAFQVQGVTVSQYEAMLAAKAWTASGEVLGTEVDSTVSSADEIAVTNNLVVHAVKMRDGHTVFVSGDRALEPIVAITSGTSSEDSPLIDILKRDAYIRAAAAGVLDSSSGKVSVMSTMSTASTETAASETERKWAALLAGGSGISTMSADPVSEAKAAEVITDMRVEPLLATRWSQTYTPLFAACYNYYTPGSVEGDPNNYPCGCTATAISQMIRYFQYPEALPQDAFRAYACTVDSAAESLTPLADEDDETKPRAYDYANMAAEPTDNEDECKAIGHLTYDVGVVLKSNYTSGGTGAYPTDVSRVFKAYGYPSAYAYMNGEGYDEYVSGGKLIESDVSLTGSEEIRQKTILASLDAKLPVFLGVYGFAKSATVKNSQTLAGHAVVADGYGFADIDGEATTYVHVNLGWGGTDDAWYNLPTIDTASAGATIADQDGSVFELLFAASFNVTSDENCAGKELFTGRVLDEDGIPAPNAKVTAYTTTGEVAWETTSDEKGIYALWLTGANSEYDIEAVSEDGTVSGGFDSAVKMTSTVPVDESGRVTYTVGNVWGQDITLMTPCVGIGDKTYPNLDRAIAAAADGDTIEILLPARLKRHCTIDKSVTIVATNEDAYASAVTCLDGAYLTVSNGVTVAFSNIVFSASGTVVEAQSDAFVSVAGTAVFDDLCNDYPGISTVSTNSFILAGALDNGITLECSSATDAGDVFGMYADSIAEGYANYIISLKGTDRAGASGGDGTLIWEDDAEVVAATALVTLDREGDSTLYYRSLDKLFEQNSETNGNLTVTLLREKASLTNKVEFATDSSAAWTIYAEKDDAHIDMCGSLGGFTIPGDITVVCTNAAITRTASLALSAPVFTVNSNATLTLSHGAMVRDLSVSGNAAAVFSVKGGGRLAMESSSAVTNCRVYKASSGIVQLAKGAELDMNGGAIKYCTSNGGAVYVPNGAKVNLSGSATIVSNVLYTTSNYRGIYLGTTNSIVTLTGAMEGSGGVGVYCYSSFMKDEGDAFAAIAGPAKAEAVAACKYFINENNANLFAGVNDGGSSLVWSTTMPPPVPLEGEEIANAVAIVDEKDYYISLPEAFRAATNETATIRLTRDVESFVDSVTVLSSNLTLNGYGKEIRRPDDETDDTDGFAKIDVGANSLTVKDVTLVDGAGRFFDVKGGSLTLDSGAAITAVTGSGKDFVAPIVVDCGTFTMNSGSAIANCVNKYIRESGGPLAAGAVVVTGTNETQKAKAILNGGSITSCTSASEYGAGGILIANGATVDIQGDITIQDNGVITNTVQMTTKPNNLVVQDLSALTLVGEFTGTVGVTEGWNATSKTNVFGSVSADFSGEATASAANFVHDTDDATGQVEEKLLYWYVKPSEGGGGGGGEDDPKTETVNPDPIAFTAITETETGWKLVATNRVQYCSYRLLYTDDISKGFTTTGAWEQVTAEVDAGTWITNIVTDAEAMFFRAEGKEGEKPVME